MHILTKHDDESKSGIIYNPFLILFSSNFELEYFSTEEISDFYLDPMIYDD